MIDRVNDNTPKYDNGDTKNISTDPNPPADTGELPKEASAKLEVFSQELDAIIDGSETMTDAEFKAKIEEFETKINTYLESLEPQEAEAFNEIVTPILEILETVANIPGYSQLGSDNKVSLNVMLTMMLALIDFASEMKKAYRSISFAEVEAVVAKLKEAADATREGGMVKFIFAASAAGMSAFGAAKGISAGRGLSDHGTTAQLTNTKYSAASQAGNAGGDFYKLHKDAENSDLNAESKSIEQRQKASEDVHSERGQFMNQIFGVLGSLLSQEYGAESHTAQNLG